MVMDITESDLHLAQQGARSAARSGRGIVSVNDLIGEAYLWMSAHPEKVAQWREEGKHGENKLRRACRMACLTVVARERKRQSRLEAGDLYYYNKGMVEELLPFIFTPEDWVLTSGSSEDQPEVKAPSRPSEGNNRLAMIVDLRSAFIRLPLAQRQLLADLFQDGGLPVEVVAIRLGVSERTVYRRKERAVEALIESLGGERP